MTEALPPPVPVSFASLAELRARHADLLKAVGPDVLAPDNAQQLSAFISRARQTGGILDANDERTLAQGLINFWVARLASAARTAGVEPTVPFNDTVLEPFAIGTIWEAASRADAWLAAQPDADQALARSVMLRLVRLTAVGVEFVAVPTVRAALFDLGQPDDVGRVINNLAAAGVVRIVPGEIAEMDRVLLRSPELLNSWKAFEGWRRERAEFRRRVVEWDQAGRGSVGVGLRDSEMDEARSYHDRDDRERAFIHACRKRDRRRRQLLLAGVVLLAGVLIYFAVEWRLAEAATQELSRQHRFVRTVQVVRTLAEIGEARTQTLEELVVAVNRWETLVIQLQKEEKDKVEADRYFTAVTTQLPVTRNVAGHPELRFDTTVALKVAHTLRNDLLRDEDPRVQVELKAIRTAAYERVRLCIDGMIESIRVKSFESAAPFVREFWLNYWGDMGLVEGRPVANAMVAFGKQLKLISHHRPDVEGIKTLDVLAETLRKVLSEEKLDDPVLPYGQ